jgi:hypothetical protein
MMGKTWRSRYGSLAASDDDTVLLMPAPAEIDGSDWPFYMTTITRSGDITAIVGNSSPVALLFDARSGEMSISQIDEFNCWAMRRDISCPSRHLSVQELAKRATPLPHTPVEFDIPGKEQSIVKYWRNWFANR